MGDVQNYNANDIVSLSAGKAFRQKIGMYLSADRQEAINLGLRELIVNVQDEYEVYKPSFPKLTIRLDTKNKEIWVQDNMRGIPVGIRDDGINSLIFPINASLYLFYFVYKFLKFFIYPFSVFKQSSDVGNPITF